METITSKENRIYKAVSKLTKKKYRDREKAFILEGPSQVKDAVRLGLPIREIVLREGSDQAGISGEKVTLSAKLFDSISETETSQGIFAVVERPEAVTIAGIEGKKEGKGDIVVLDRLQDPGNIGAIVRTAEATGIACIAVVKGTSDPYSQKAVRASSGAVSRVPIAFFDDGESLLEELKKNGIGVLTTDVSSGTGLFEAELGKKERQPLALVIGNEGNGVSELLAEAGDIKVNIPMKGSIESLNAAVAAGVIMYEMAKPF